MFSSLRLFTKTLRAPLGTQAVSHASKRKDAPIIVDITYEEMAKRHQSANGKIFIFKPKRSNSAKIDSNLAFIRKAYRKCTVFKEIVVRRRILTQLPDKRKQHFTFSQFKDVQVITPKPKPCCELLDPDKV